MALMAGLALLLAACGSDAEEADDETTTTAAADDETTTTAAEEEETTTTAAEEEKRQRLLPLMMTDAADDAGSGIGVTLNDDFELIWPAILRPARSPSTSRTRAPISLTRSPSCGRPASMTSHAMRRTAQSTPTPWIAADIIGSTTVPMAGGTSEDLTVDLEAGDYVFFCPISERDAVSLPGPVRSSA